MGSGKKALLTLDVSQPAMVDRLLAWFRENQRDLPWRRTYDPYHVWISEVMLQQTQMERGVSRFLKWIERFPDVAAVAAASEQEVLKAWEGLGYYARARNLHRAAQQMVEKHGGIVPCDHEALLGLPGIGAYTAAAISSIAGNRDHVAIDANVIRVIARLHDIAGNVKSGPGRQRVERLARLMLPPGRARQFNQAMMEFGALVCRPRNPDCGGCPLADGCAALAAGSVALRPDPGKAVEVIEEGWLAAVVIEAGRLLIRKRPAAGLWGGLWELPGGRVAGAGSDIVHMDTAKVQKELEVLAGIRISNLSHLVTVKHQYTNHRATVVAYRCERETAVTPADTSDNRWVGAAELAEYGFPAGSRKILSALLVGFTSIFTNGQ